MSRSHLLGLLSPPSSEGQPRPDQHPTSGAGPLPCASHPLPSCRRSGLCQVGVSAAVPGKAPRRRTHGGGAGAREPSRVRHPEQQEAGEKGLCRVWGSQGVGGSPQRGWSRGGGGSEAGSGTSELGITTGKPKESGWNFVGAFQALGTSFTFACLILKTAGPPRDLVPMLQRRDGPKGLQIPGI